VVLRAWEMTEPWLGRRSLVGWERGRSPACHRGESGSVLRHVHVGFVVDKVARVSLQVLPLSPLRAILPLLLTHRLSRALFHLGNGQRR
jgi:hypothetical protein